jgi:serine/threonine protein kinase
MLGSGTQKSPEADPIATDMHLPGYNILRKLNSGGMASVFLATQLSLNRTVALKIMKPELDYDPEFHNRFQREAEIVGQLSHPNIIPIYDIGRYNGMNYISMEYLPAGSLDQKIKKGIGANLAASYVMAMASALAHAHNKGYVHRDIKPENILFRADGSPVLTDFGIARLVKSDSSMTQVGNVMGTPYYMSPEQAKGEAIDGRSDLYSLGVLFYEMLTGTRPFQNDDALSLALQHITEQPPRLPDEVSIYQDILDKLLAKTPTQRFQSGRELVQQLKYVKSFNNPVAQAHVNQTQASLKETQEFKVSGFNFFNSIQSKFRNPFFRFQRNLSSNNPSNSSSNPMLAETQALTAIETPDNQFWRPKYIAILCLMIFVISSAIFIANKEINVEGPETVKLMPFTVITEPEFAKVRILNIKEKYQPDMALPQGNYQLEISAPGYDTKTEWVHFSKTHELIKYELYKSTTDNSNLLSPELVEIVVDVSGNNGDATNVSTIKPQKNFYIGKYEVTFDEYDYFAKANNLDLPEDNGWGRGKRPVINVSWNDAQAYIDWLSKTNGKRYRLPTDLEWEFAARGYSTEQFWWGKDANDAESFANCRYGCKPWLSALFGNKTKTVGAYPANTYGLYDISGNVAEWVADCGDTATENLLCKERVIRGGSFNDSVKNISLSAKSVLAASKSNITTGFRLVQDIDEEVASPSQPSSSATPKDRVQRFFRRLFK